MIFDRIKNHHLYENISPLIAKAFEHINDTDLSTLAPGRYHVEGDKVYVIVSEYQTKQLSLGKWEAHRRYIDLQYMIDGTELIGVSPIVRMKPGVYDQEKDFLLLEGRGDLLMLKCGDFMILWPDDAHMPGIAADIQVPVKKAVYKILL